MPGCIYQLAGNRIRSNRKGVKWKKNQLLSYLEIAIRPATGRYNGYLFVDDSMSLSSILAAPYKDGIFTDNNNGQFFVQSTKSLQDEEWYQKALELNGMGFWFMDERQPEDIFFARTLQQNVIQNNTCIQRRLGVLLIRMDASWIKSSIDMSKWTIGTQMFVLTNDCSIIYSSAPDISQTAKTQLVALCADGKKNSDDSSFTKENTIVYFLGVENYLQISEMENGLLLATLVPVHGIDEQASGIVSIVIVISAFVILIGIAMVWVLSANIVKPIRKLSNHMQNNQMLVPISEENMTDDEVGSLYHNFNGLMEHEKKLLEQNYQAVKEKEEAEFKVLQAQINPHFLYNTLDTVCCKALINKQEEIAAALSSMAAMLRYNIKEPDCMVTLEQELRIIKDYIDIQKMRTNLLSIDYDIAIDIGEVMVPKMIIQPLVENCINHGASKKDGTVQIILSCTEENEMIVISVEDEGNCDDINGLNDYLQGKQIIVSKEGGLGIRNVQQRIQKTYGSSYGLHFEREKNGGTVATIKLPLTYRKEMEIEV